MGDIARRVSQLAMRRRRHRDSCRSCWRPTRAGRAATGPHRCGDEIELAYAAFSNDDLLSQVGMEWMLAGVVTRRHARVNELVGDDLDAQARSTSRSWVSRRFKAATDAQLDELIAATSPSSTWRH